MRIHVTFKDRVGITQEILMLLGARNLNLDAVEMSPPNVYIDAPTLSQKVLDELHHALLGVTGVQAVDLVDILPGQRRRLQLEALPQKDGKYVALESTTDTWDNIASRHDHPSFLMALGQLPGAGVDRAVMRRTLDAVLANWDWKTKIWGWDYPMIAMTAARLGATREAVDVLLKTDGPNNGYTAAGHNPNTNLPVYLPGNGALLAAVALMAGGWDGAPAGAAPGFPREGWVVRAEGFAPLP